MNLLLEWFSWYLYPLKPCCFKRMERLESSLFSTTLIRDKYILHIINEIVSMVGHLRDLVYTNKYKEIITLI
jgi:hypothetical protein